MKFLSGLFAVLALVASAHAEHLPGQITGTDIALFERDHSFAGEIAKWPANGFVDEATGVAHMTVRMDGRNVVLDLAMDTTGKVYSGAITDKVVDEVSGATKSVETKVKLGGLKKTGPSEGMLSLSIDGNVVDVMIKGESFANNHFHNPTYSAALNGKPVEFKLMGEACFGYSANLNMMILSALAHIAKY